MCIRDRRDVFHLRVGEALPGGGDLVLARYRKAGQRVVAGGIGQRGPFQPALLVPGGDLYARHRGAARVSHLALYGGRVWRLREHAGRENQKAGTEEFEHSAVSYTHLTL